MSFKNAIALTGGIATGKSSVCSLLNLYGFQIIDADKVAHKVLQAQAPKVAELFGEAYVVNGSVDRKKLGGLVFSDKEERKRLENLLHPLIRQEIQKEAAFCESKEVPYIVDIPLFYESGSYDIDEVAVIYCTKEQQLERLTKREGYSEEEAKRRIDAQMPIDEKRDKATFVIDNTQNLKHLQNEVERFITYVRQKYPDMRV